MFGEVIDTTSQHSNEKISHNTTKPLVTNYNTLQGAKSHSQEKFLNHAFLHIILMMYHVRL